MIKCLKIFIVREVDMTRLEQDILALLQEDARFTPKKLAQMLSTTEDEILKAIATLESSGVIVKYSTIINSDKIEDDTVQALIEVRVTPEKEKGFDAIAEEIVQFDEVESLSLMSGGYDFCVIVNGKTLKDVAMFVTERLSRLSGVLSTATHFILKKYKINGIVVDKTKEHRLAVGA